MVSNSDVNLFGGIQTFLGRKYVESPRGDEDVIVLGVPLDSGASYIPGARFGPSGIRRASMIYRFYDENEGLLDISSSKALLKGVKVVDLGDLDLPFGDQKEAMRLIYEKTSLLKGLKAFKVFLGGDHSITFPLVKALKDEYGEIGLVHVDAHLDMMSSHFGNMYTHGSPILRCIDEANVKPNMVVSIGVRGFLNCSTSLESAMRLGVNVLTMRRVKELGVEEVAYRVVELLRGIPVYLTFDIDSMDPSIAPGTGVLELGGFMYDEVAELVTDLFQNLNIVAMDMVEVCPLLDVNDITSKLATSIILEALKAKFQH